MKNTKIINNNNKIKDKDIINNENNINSSKKTKNNEIKENKYKF